MEQGCAYLLRARRPEATSAPAFARSVRARALVASNVYVIGRSPELSAIDASCRRVGSFEASCQLLATTDELLPQTPRRALKRAPKPVNDGVNVRAMNDSEPGHEQGDERASQYQTQTFETHLELSVKCETCHSLSHTRT